jgi:hypothetical protein
VNAARQRSARRAVLAGLALVLAVHLAVGAGLDGPWAALRDPEYGCRLASLWERRKESPGRPLVVAIGSSRTQMGLKPDAIRLGPVALAGRPAAEPLVFNLGLAGCGPVTELVVLRRLLGDGVRPDWVLLEVLPPALVLDWEADTLLGGDRAKLLKQSDLEVVRPYCRDSDAMRGEWLRSRLNPVSTVRFCLLSRFIPGWLPPQYCRRYLWEDLDGLGWLNYPVKVLTPEYRHRQLEHARGQYADNLAHFHIAMPPDRAVREAIGLCRSEGIGVALYLMPEGEEFRRMYTPGAREQLDRYLAGLGRDIGVRVIDARDWVPDEAEFTDSHHLLPAGAVRFSERFGREAVGPLLRGGVVR